MTTLKAPFPYFGGKHRAAPLVWDALGDPAGYVEPFAGSAAVLLARPRFKGRRVETLNDADGWLVNTWRAIQLAPDDVARHAFGPVTEIDYHARLAWLQQRRTPELVSWLEGDPEHYDAKAAGWWLYVSACGIGDPWGPGPWRVQDGHLVKAATAEGGVNKEIPHFGNAGRGVNRGLPHLGDAGQGVNNLTAYMRALADRLHRVRITCGSWERVVGDSVTRAGTGGDGTRALLLDPPYATSGDLYASTNTSDEHRTISAKVRQWCLSASDDLRIVLCGYDSEHNELLDHGWSVISGKSGGGAGYSTNSGNGKRERLWTSPACLTNQATFDFTALENA